MEKEHYLLRDTAGNPERIRQRPVARSGSQSQPRIQFIFPARGASCIIKRLSPSTWDIIYVFNNKLLHWM